MIGDSHPSGQPPAIEKMKSKRKKERAEVHRQARRTRKQKKMLRHLDRQKKGG